MKESLYLSKKITELKDKVTFLNKKIVLLENENEILRKRLSNDRSWFSKLKDIFKGNITFEIIMPWSKDETKKSKIEKTVQEDIRKYG